MLKLRQYESFKRGWGEISMTVTLLLFLICLGAGLFFIGGFLWSAMEQKPRAIWLIGAAASLMVGLAGFVVNIK